MRFRKLNRNYFVSAQSSQDEIFTAENFDPLNCSRKSAEVEEPDIFGCPSAPDPLTHVQITPHPPHICKGFGSF